MRRAAGAVTRFHAFRWLAAYEANRALRRRLTIEPDDANQAALIGLHQADLAAPATMPEREFQCFARFRIRGAIIDEHRRISHGARQKRRATSLKPWRADPTDVYVAQLDGLLPLAIELDGEVTAVCRSPNPEQAALDAEAERERQRRLDALPEREGAVVRMRLAGQKVQEIASLLRVSQPRVSQLFARAMKQIVS